jgi:hypothetical protein
MKLGPAQVILNVAAVLLTLATGPLWSATEGTSSTFYGQGAGSSGSSSSGSNTFVGYYAGFTNNSGYDNAFFGYGAGFYNDSGLANAFFGYHAGLYNVNGADNTFLGSEAGLSNSSAFNNTFVGSQAGRANTTACCNTFLGSSAGAFNTTGEDNTFLGVNAGYANITGYRNTFIGEAAGTSNTAGHDNLFLGRMAGSTEGGSNKLYIDTCLSGGSCTSPFIYGEFDNHLLRINGVTEVHANGAAKSQLNFSQASTDTGGYLTSVLDNNFFMSSGARYDATSGGWIQRSGDQQSVIQGSGSLGYRVFTSSGHTVGSNFTPTVRLQIDYSGQFGINQAPVAGHEIHTATGAYEAGGSWVDGSSRKLKERIAPLSADAAVQTLAALEPVTFVYKTDAQQQHVGFIAEDVPELVAMKDRRGLSPMDIVAVLTKVVQQQKQTIEQQQRALEEIAAKFARMETEIERLMDGGRLSSR